MRKTARKAGETLTWVPEVEVSDTVTVTRGLNDEGSRLTITVSIDNAQISKAFVELIEKRCAVFVIDVPWNPGERPW